jgi:hypothetical protein
MFSNKNDKTVPPPAEKRSKSNPEQTPLDLSDLTQYACGPHTPEPVVKGRAENFKYQNEYDFATAVQKDSKGHYRLVHWLFDQYLDKVASMREGEEPETNDQLRRINAELQKELDNLNQTYDRNQELEDEIAGYHRMKIDHETQVKALNLTVQKQEAQLKSSNLTIQHLHKLINMLEDPTPTSTIAGPSNIQASRTPIVIATDRDISADPDTLHIRSAASPAPGTDRVTPDRTTSPPSGAVDIKNWPHPDVFDGEDPKKFNPWVSELRGKIEASPQSLCTSGLRIKYARSRLSGRPYRIVSPFVDEGAFHDFEDLIAELEATYGDHDKESRAESDLEALKCGTGPNAFNEFYAEFRRLQAILKEPERTQITKVRSKVNGRLSNHLRGRRFESLSEMVQTCRQFEEDTIIHAIRFPRDSKSTPNSNSSRLKSATSNSTPTPSNHPNNRAETRPDTRSDPDKIPLLARFSHEEIKQMKSTGTCFKCEEPGHRVSDCTAKEWKRTPRPGYQAVRAHQVEVASEQENATPAN